MNQAEFARFHGVSRKTVTAWKKKGWVVLNADDTVDTEKSNDNLRRNRSGKYQSDSPVTHTVTRAEKVTGSGNTYEGNSTTQSEFVGQVQSDDIDTLDRSEIDRRLQAEKYKTEREKARAAKFETDIREGRLLLAEDVARHDAEVGSRLKNKLLSLPTELAVRLAAMSNPAAVEGLLRAEVTDALNEFLDAYGISDSG